MTRMIISKVNLNVNLKRYRILLIFMLCLLVAAALPGSEPAFATSKAAFRNSQVKSVKVTSVNYKTVKVSWKKTAGANGYQVLVSTSHYGKYSTAATVKKGSATSAKIGKRVTGKVYYFKVRAYMGSGGARVYNKYSYSQKGKAVPAKPAVDLSAEEVLAPATKIKVGYSEVAGASGYEIQRSTSKTKNFKTIGTTSSGRFVYVDQTGVENKTYYYRVRAFRTVSGKKVNGTFSKVKSIAYPRLKGNLAKYNAENVTPAGLDLSSYSAYFIGSSVTRGRGGEGQSFVDQLAVRNGLSVTKEAIDGTTLSTLYARSYVARLKNLPAQAPSFLVCQLSTNDSRNQVPLGDLEKGYDISKFNTKTVTGAMQYVIGYARDTWNCPVIFYTVPKFTSTKFHDEEYKKMVNRLQEVQTKWQTKISVSTLDLWNDPAIDQQLAANRALYMADEIHPTKAGYLNLYTPGMADLMATIVNSVQTQEVEPSMRGTSVDLNEGFGDDIVLGNDGLPMDDFLTP